MNVSDSWIHPSFRFGFAKLFRDFILGLTCTFFITASACSSAQDDGAVEAWIRQSAIPFDDSTKEFGSMENVFSKARIIALGEATHGQHEVFGIKRQLTMHLIRNHRVRIVAYEASASQMLKANEYISGKHDNLNRAMSGFGMMIWQIEENQSLLRDLREWNRSSDMGDQVRLIGFDAQDTEEAMIRLMELVGEKDTNLVARVRATVQLAKNAANASAQGNQQGWNQLAADVESLNSDLQKHKPQLSSEHAEFDLRVQEFVSSLMIYQSNTRRDKTMAELLLKQIERSGNFDRCVVWAHNAHIQRSPLGFLGSNEPAMGGHLANRLGEDFYALGVAFGQGEFQANAQTIEKTWGFRSYRLSSAPTASLEWTLGKAGHDRFLLDLRSAPNHSSVQEWLNSGHGQRWFGGYSIPDNCDELTRDASKLMKTVPAKDFDGLIYVNKTTSAKPIDRKRNILNGQ